MKQTIILLLLVSIIACKGPSQREDHFTFVTAQLRYALDCTAEARAQSDDKRLVSPRTVEKDGSLRLVAPRDWCSGFFPGSLWQTYAHTGDDFWQQKADEYTRQLEPMKNFTGTHDLGFIIFNSFGQGYKLTGDTYYKEVALTAAQSLTTRYNDTVKAIRSWDWSSHWKYPVIIDNMLNLELLFWASEETGDPRYREIAVNHANTTLKHHFREDNSSWHVIDYDPQTGEVLHRETHQGIADESVWSRGQAWGLYGFTMCYRFTKDLAYLEQAEKIADFFFSQQNLPADKIAYWDMKDPAIPDAPRDASASAIMASALYELATFAEAPKNEQYKTIADQLTDNLTGNYRAQSGTMQGFLLLHSTGNYPKNDEIDAPISYADYYYLEALLRKKLF